MKRRLLIYMFLLLAAVAIGLLLARVLDSESNSDVQARPQVVKLVPKAKQLASFQDAVGLVRACAYQCQANANKRAQLLNQLRTIHQPVALRELSGPRDTYQQQLQRALDDPDALTLVRVQGEDANKSWSLLLGPAGDDDLVLVFDERSARQTTKERDAREWTWQPLIQD